MTPISAEAPKQEDRTFNPNEDLTYSENTILDVTTPEKTPGEEATDDGETDNLSSDFIDTGENIDNENIAKKNKTKKIGIAVATAAGAVIVAGAVLISSLGGNKNKAPKATNDNLPAGFTDTTTADEEAVGETTIIISEDTSTTKGSETTAAITTETDKNAETSGETNPEKQYDYSRYVENAVECYGFFELTTDQQSEIKKFEAMSIEEYQAQPQEEQLKFAFWFFENYKGRFDYLAKGAEINLSYKKDPTTPQEYSDNYVYVTTMASSIFTNSQRDDGTYTGNKTDILTGQKIMVLRDTATEVHNEGNNSYVNRYDGLVIFAKLDHTVVGYKATENGMILNIHQETTDTITVEPDATDGQRIIEPITFIDINGKETVLKTCVLSIPITDSRVVEVTPVE